MRSTRLKPLPPPRSSAIMELAENSPGTTGGAVTLPTRHSLDGGLMRYTYPEPGKEPFNTPESEMREAWES